jgi:FeS assembly protein SufD
MLNSNVVSELSKNEPEWLVKIRRNSLETFEKLPLPYFKYGIAISNDLSNFNLDSLNPLELQDVEIISEGAEVLLFEDALKKYPKVLQSFFSSAEFGKNKFTSLHGAFFNQTLVVVVPKNTKAKVKINLKLKTTLIQNLIIVAEENSELEFIETLNSVSKDFRSQFIKVIAKRGAKIRYFTLQDFADNVNNFVERKADLRADSSLVWVDYLLGSKLTKLNSSNELNGPGASAKTIGAFLGENKQSFDLYIESVHNARDTHSDILTHGTLNDESKSIYRGLIKIKNGAKNSRGYQKESTLLLSDKVKADAVPKLEINEKEVKCSHGTAIGRLDNEKLFYLMARGLDEKSAKTQLIKAFFEPIESQLKSKEAVSKLKVAISKKLERAVK